METVITPQPKEVKLEEKKKLEPHEELLNAFVSEGLDSATAKILVAQAAFESGNFRNELTKKSKNCFAILHYSKRQTLSLGSHGYADGHTGYAVYNSLDSAARDFVLFLKSRDIKAQHKSINDYALAIKLKHYYGWGDVNRTPKLFWKEYNQYANGMKFYYRKLWEPI